jgi:methylase of polypeptide subunit release factors
MRSDILGIIMSKESDSSRLGVNPELTQRFVKFIEDSSREGVYRVQVHVGEVDVPIDVFPTVFPPRSDYSVSSRSVFETFGDLSGLSVADIGSGSGIESIVAALAGAAHVDAADIHQQAVACSLHNVQLNNLEEKITVFHSDLFSAFPTRKYDLIIANLPIVDFDAGRGPIQDALYDPSLKTHERLLEQSRHFLAENGTIVFTHANLQSIDSENPAADFIKLEHLIKQRDYKIIEKNLREDLGHTWINYRVAV